MAVLECKALTKNYGHMAALDSVDFAIEPGRIVGLLWVLWRGGSRAARKRQASALGSVLRRKPKCYV